MGVVLITGTSTGIGRLATETLARAGHTVYASMRAANDGNRNSAEDLRRLAREAGLDIRVLEMDVQDAGSVQTAVGQVLREVPKIDVVVNNAGLMSIGVAEGFTEPQIAHQMDVNFMGAVRVCRAVLPNMRAHRGGLIIHVTSIVGRILFPGCAFYCASKFAHEAFAEVLHYELTGTGVESVIVEPGPYGTQLLANSPGPEDQDRLAGYGELAGLRQRFVAHFAEFFASADAPDPQEVADAILRLIGMPAGTRPMRTVCGVDFRAAELNRVVASFQADVLRDLGMQHMMPNVGTQHVGKASA
jgi:NAD(P)-dependent dehydrogenase (short-subunit alcohol dehydrogenase family)